MPNTLEIEYNDNINRNCIKEKDNTFNITKTLGQDIVVWCQTGLNAPESREVFNTYCRVITFVENCEPGEVPGRHEDFDMDEETWESFFLQAEKEYETTGQTIIKRLGFGKINFNGYPGIYICFIRSGWKNSPPVIVYKYTIFNNNVICRIDFAYRENEAEKWSDIKNLIAKTFTFDLNSISPEDSYANENNGISSKVFSESFSDSYIISWFVVIILIILVIAYIYYKKEEKL